MEVVVCVRNMLERSTSISGDIIVHANCVNSATGTPGRPIFGLFSVLIFA